MYPIWLLAAFFVGALDCVPLQTPYDICPNIKTSKLVHADFLNGCGKRNTGTASDKLCTLYEEILKQLCASVKDKKLPFSNADIDKALQSTDLTKVCDVLSHFKLADVAKTKEILLPITNNHCFRTCQSDDYTILPICNYGAYMLNFIHVFSAHPALEDLKEKKTNTIVNTLKADPVSKSGNTSNVKPSSSNVLPSANTNILQLQPRINNVTLDTSKKNESKPEVSLTSSSSNVNDKKGNPPIIHYKLNNKSNAPVASKTQDKPLTETHLGSHRSNPAAEQDQVNSTKETIPIKNSQDQEDLHKTENDKEVAVEPMKSNDLPDAHVNDPNKETAVEPMKLNNSPATHVNNLDNMDSGSPKDIQKSKEEPSKKENQELNKPVIQDIVNAPQEEVAGNNVVSGGDDTSKQDNPLEQNNHKVASSPVQNIENVNPQEQLQSQDPDDEDGDNDLGILEEINGNTEPFKSPNEVPLKLEEKKPIKTEYSDSESTAHGFTSENSDDGDSPFFPYFMVICLVFIGGYVIYHNKQRILALIVEGRRGRRGSRSRRPNSANYKKLDSNLEEAISSSCNKSAAHVIY